MIRPSGVTAVASTITNAYATIIGQAHTAGIKVYGATLLPIGNSVKYTAANEATRQAVNAWIRTGKAFDAVVDFEAATRDPNNPKKDAPRPRPSGDATRPA